MDKFNYRLLKRMESRVCVARKPTCSKAGTSKAFLKGPEKERVRLVGHTVGHSHAISATGTRKLQQTTADQTGVAVSQANFVYKNRDPACKNITK